MKQVIRYRAIDGKEFDSSAECSAYEDQLAASEAIREEYAVVVRTGRVDAVIAGITIDPEPMLRILTALLKRKPIVNQNKIPRGMALRLPRTSAQLLNDVTAFLAENPFASISAVLKGVGGKGDRVRGVLFANFATATDGRWHPRFDNAHPASTDDGATEAVAA
ncbi:MAG: hypothetical protein ACAI43_09880 [Phycisphaerae bacterium]|nr:hypothetical protein [Tepidisphaeraceae bacterium]